MDMQTFNSTMANISKNVARRERELFGNRRSLPADEFDIVFSSRFTHEEKVSRLAIIRNAKAARRAARKSQLN